MHRAVSFIRYWRTRSLSEKRPTLPDRGQQVGKAVPVRDGTVTIHTGPTGYTLSYDVKPGGPGTAADAQWLQFVWRRVAAVRDKKEKRPAEEQPLARRIDRPFGGSLFQFPLTANPNAPSWNTDTSQQSSPFFEEGTGTVERTPSTLTMFDAPSPDVASVEESFDTATNNPDRVEGRFHATTYLVKGMDVLYRADIDIKWPFVKRGVVPAPKITAKGGPDDKISSAHRARLMTQFGELDYLPGGSIPKPAMKGQFGFIGSAMDERAWRAMTGWRERFAAVAQVAGADRFADVWRLSPSAIKQVDTVDDGEPGTAGLNYATKLPEEGTVRFIDADGKFSARLPVSDRAKLPRIAIVLGPDAFARDAAFALGTIRHEMEHARHFELAIGWFLKWRADRPGAPFWQWIDTQKIPTNVRALLGYAKKDGARSPTELLAHIEGVVATLPSLPKDPDMSHMRTGDFPAAMSTFRTLGAKGFIGGANDVRADALSRLRAACCQDATLGPTLVKWIDAVLNPQLLNPTAADEKQVKMIKNDFGIGPDSTAGQKELKTFLDEVRARVSKPCGKS